MWGVREKQVFTEAAANTCLLGCPPPIAVFGFEALHHFRTGSRLRETLEGS